MKLKTACGIALDCGLNTIGEAIMNIDVHAISVFSYSEMNKELAELYEDTKGIDLEAKIKQVFPDLKEENPND